jgi:hypothetical protein
LTIARNVLNTWWWVVFNIVDASEDNFVFKKSQKLNGERDSWK